MDPTAHHSPNAWRFNLSHSTLRFSHRLSMFGMNWKTLSGWYRRQTDKLTEHRSDANKLGMMMMMTTNDECRPVAPCMPHPSMDNIRHYCRPLRLDCGNDERRAMGDGDGRLDALVGSIGGLFSVCPLPVSPILSGACGRPRRAPVALVPVKPGFPACPSRTFCVTHASRSADCRD